MFTSDPDPALDPALDPAPARTDIDRGIEWDLGAHGTHSISEEISPAIQPAKASPVDDRGLPDFVALIQAELAAAGAAEDERARVKPSFLGAGEIVLAARELAGLSQRRLAARLGTSQPSISRIESGNRMPTVRTLMRVAEAAELELVIGLRRPGADRPRAKGAPAAKFPTPAGP